MIIRLSILFILVFITKKGNEGSDESTVSAETSLFAQRDGRHVHAHFKNDPKSAILNLRDWLNLFNQTFTRGKQGANISEK